ncbi:MAG: exonuclease SbcCD subunit D [Bacteroidales bacterium]|nr:exonuclease SbcCD subunit D [Bacteroidales bacterium]
MKILHTSDLHLGKRVNDYSMIDEQKNILKEILSIIESEKPDAVILAGDIYDKSIPSVEAVNLFDEFLVELDKFDNNIFAISGNHDSPERIAFASRIMDRLGLHFSPVYDGNVKPVVLQDEFGEVNFYMLPFVKPLHVRQFFPDAEINNYTDAVRVAIENMNVDMSQRNVMVAHQFISDASRRESETVSVGGLDNVDANVFDGFDYVALGHLHGAQNCGNEHVRYSGTPLKYSFSEVNDEKSVTIIELGAKGDMKVRTVPLHPIHEWRDLRGTYEEVTNKDFYNGTTYREDYVRITLTDENDIVDAIGKLRSIYHNIMELRYDNKRTRNYSTVDVAANPEKQPSVMFSELFEMQNSSKMEDEQTKYVEKMLNEILEDRQ